MWCPMWCLRIVSQSSGAICFKVDFGGFVADEFRSGKSAASAPYADWTLYSMDLVVKLIQKQSQTNQKQAVLVAKSCKQRHNHFPPHLPVPTISPVFTVILNNLEVHRAHARTVFMLKYNFFQFFFQAMPVLVFHGPKIKTALLPNQIGQNVLMQLPLKFLWELDLCFLHHSFVYHRSCRQTGEYPQLAERKSFKGYKRRTRKQPTCCRSLVGMHWCFRFACRHLNEQKWSFQLGNHKLLHDAQVISSFGFLRISKKIVSEK